MSSTFPKVRRGARGYDIAQVEDFLEDARRSYGAEVGTPSGMSASAIRTVAFDLVRGGYSTEHVDAALERLEEAFAVRERESVIATSGQDAWYAKTRDEAQEILDRLALEPKRRFRRVSAFTLGYDVKQVDSFSERLVDYFQNGVALDPVIVRTVEFRAVRGGYDESQVDMVLDAVVDVMLAVR